jgi:hypothetical protein
MKIKGQIKTSWQGNVATLVNDACFMFENNGKKLFSHYFLFGVRVMSLKMAPQWSQFPIHHVVNF